VLFFHYLRENKSKHVYQHHPNEPVLIGLAIGVTALIMTVCGCGRGEQTKERGG